MGSVCSETLERRWNNVCRVLFREEIGRLEDFVPWLARYNEKLIRRQSYASKKEVTFADADYADESRFISLDEIDFAKKWQPLSINDVKDIDSLFAAASERFAYAGNVILGNFGFVEKSSNVSDSFYMHETGRLADCKYIGYSTLGRLGEDCFGCNGIGESQFCIHSYETFRDKRCFELWMGQNCTDCYYSHGLDSCTECMFSFHLKNRSHCIGNLALETGKYRELKSKLLSEIAGELRRKKSLPSLVDIAGKCKGEMPDLKLELEEREVQDKGPIEDAFFKTSRLLLGKGLIGMDGYSDWLKKHTRRMERRQSALSGKDVFRHDYACYFHLPLGRLITEREALALGEQAKLSEGECESLGIGNAHERIGKIAYFASEYAEGTHLNLIECATSSSSSHCYRSSPIVYAKYCGYSFWPRSTEYAFGCGALLDSEFCINCYYSAKLRRCFECDSCRDCSDAYFCHNCENVRDSLLCSNAKNLRYAIGNAEVGREKFLRAKKMLCDWLIENLEKKRTLERDIYHMAVRG